VYAPAITDETCAVYASAITDEKCGVRSGDYRRRRPVADPIQLPIRSSRRPDPVTSPCAVYASAITDEARRLPDQRSIAIPDKVLLFWFNISLLSIDERSVVSEYIAQYSN